MRKGDFEFLKKVKEIVDGRGFDGLATRGPETRRANRLVMEGFLNGPVFGGCEDFDEDTEKQEPGEYPIYTLTEKGKWAIGPERDENSQCRF